MAMRVQAKLWQLRRNARKGLSHFLSDQVVVYGQSAAFQVVKQCSYHAQQAYCLLGNLKWG